MLLFSIAALAFGGGTLFLVQDLLQGRATTDGAEIRGRLPDVTKILVAARALTPGTSIKTDDLAWHDWPAAMLDPAYIRATARGTEKFTGHIVRTEIVAGEPITAERIVAPDSRSALAAMTNPGSRAVSISLNPTSGVSGLIMPGDRVDVVLTYILPRPAEGSGNGIERRAAETILGNLRVLAVDQRLSNAPNDAKEIHNASLEVTPQQSQVLALAADLGKLSLSLHGIEQTASDTVTTGITTTIDYQVGRLLPRLSAPGPSRNVRQRRLVAGPSLVEFHGGPAAASGSVH